MRINGLWIYHYLSVGYRRQKVIRMTQRILSLANRKTLGRLLRRSLQKIYQPLKSMLSWNHRAVLHSALSVRISLKSNSDPSWVSSHVHQAGLPHHMESEGSSTMGEQTCVMLNSSLTCEPTEPKRKTDRKQERWLQVQIKCMKCWYTWEEAAERGWRWSSRWGRRKCRYTGQCMRSESALLRPWKLRKVSCLQFSQQSSAVDGCT